MSRQREGGARASRRAFSLAEVLVTMTAFGIVMASVLSLLLHSSNFAAYNQGKLLISRDIRSFTNALSERATFSNFFVIYKSFDNRAPIDEGKSGDFLALAFVDPQDPTLYTRIVGFFRAATAKTEGPVRTFDIAFDEPSNQELAELLPDPATQDSHDEIIELSKGLSDGRLFYNFFNRSVTVQGEILHDGSLHKQVSNTYNFTVSPRG